MFGSQKAQGSGQREAIRRGIVRCRTRSARFARPTRSHEGAPLCREMSSSVGGYNRHRVRRRENLACPSTTAPLRSLERLGQVREHVRIVAERLDADRLERRAFTEAIAAPAPAGHEGDGAPRNHGGTFFARTPRFRDTEISGREDQRRCSPTMRRTPMSRKSMCERRTLTPRPGTTIELSDAWRASPRGCRPRV